MAMSLDDLKFAVAERGQPWAWSWHKTQREAQKVKRERETVTGKFYDVLTDAEFTQRHNAYFLEQTPLREITGDFYDEMMCVLPPMYRQGAMGFFMCEFTAGPITNQFVCVKSDFTAPRYYMAAVNICDRETWISPEKIAALAPAPRLAWFNREEGEPAA